MLDSLFAGEPHHVYPALYLICLLLLGSITYSTIRKFYFHPLRNFPGPLAASLTDFYHTYLLSTRLAHRKQLELHHKYGSVVRIAPNLLSLSDPALLPAVYHVHAEKTPFYSPFIAGAGPALLQIQEDKPHAARLRTLSPTVSISNGMVYQSSSSWDQYSLRNLRPLESKVDDVIAGTLSALRERFADNGKAVNLADYVRWHVYDTMTYLIYGKPTGMVEKGSDVDGLIEEWHRMFPFAGLLASLPWLFRPLLSIPVLRSLLMPSKSQNFGTGHIMSSHGTMFTDRRKAPHLALPGNMFDSLLQSKNPDGTPLSKDEAEHECFLLTVGSQDTTSAFISGFVDLLMQNPDTYTKLREEIAEHNHNDHLSSPVVRYEETTNIPFFMACVQETLRFAPPVSLALPRYAPADGMTLGGIWVPETVELAANPYVIHRNRQIFGTDADIFRPERWLEDSSEMKSMHKYFFAFGYGSRRCIGKNIALFTAQKLLVQLLRDFELVPFSQDETCQVENYGINFYQNQYVNLKRNIRNDEAAKKAP